MPSLLRIADGTGWRAAIAADASVGVPKQRLGVTGNTSVTGNNFTTSIRRHNSYSVLNKILMLISILKFWSMCDKENQQQQTQAKPHSYLLSTSVPPLILSTTTQLNHLVEYLFLEGLLVLFYLFSQVFYWTTIQNIKAGAILCNVLQTEIILTDESFTSHQFSHND